jgi:hypothetical protein
MAISISGNGKTVYGPRIARDGLILYYDAFNTKSFKGEPTTNLVPSPYSLSTYAYATGPVATTSTNHKLEVVTVQRYTISQVVNVARAAIYPTSMSLNTSYTLSLKWRYNGTNTTTPDMAFTSSKGNPEGGGGNTMATETETTTSLGNGWYYSVYTFSFSASPTLGCILTFGISTGSDSAYLNQTFDVYEVQFEVKAYATTYILGSRGTTVATGGGWADLTTNAYHGVLTNGTREDTAGRGSLLFDGVDDYISIVSPSNRWEWTPSGSGLNTMTIDLWVKTTDADGYVVSKPWNGNGEYNYWIHAGNSWYTNIGNQFHYQNFTSYATGNWENVTCIVTPTQKAVYRNGVLNASFANHGITNNIPGSGNSSLPLALMTLYPYENTFNQPSFSNSGNLGLFRIYNRVLTATEIAYNYQANRARYVT